MKKPSLLLTFIPLVFLVALLIINVIVFKDDASYGPNQTALLLSALVAGLIGYFFQGVTYKTIEHGINTATSSALSSMIILIIVGALIGSWILSGTVPAMIYYGLKLINPVIFLPVTCVICCIVSLATGSSWSTSGTIGIALIGIGQTLDMNLGMVAGAIISGAYFGDKMSPLSDTTNLAPAMAGTDLFTHIKHMTYTSGPAIIISLVLFTILGFTSDVGSIDQHTIANLTSTLETNFNISIWTFIPPVIVLLMVRKKIPALPALAFGTIAGVITALFLQPELINILSKGSSVEQVYKLVTEVLFGGFSHETGHRVIDKLLNRGGMSGMLTTVWLIFSAMVFGGTLEATGMIDTLGRSILKLVTGTGSLIGATLGTCIVLNATASDQYLAIVVPGRMFKDAYDEYGLAPENLSRALEDAGTVTSVLIPWNSGGAYNAGVLGVPTLAYAPYCFFNILSPCVSLFLATMNWTIVKKIKEGSST